jgi:oxygen-independent coproporphyrinogen-3 oxidase
VRATPGPGPVALYVHVPFCLSVCPYCDFVVYGGREARGPDNRVAQLVDALEVEIGLRAVASPLGSVYLGGGTPSLLAPFQVDRLLAAAHRGFGIAPGAEVTIEVNPGPQDRGDLAGFRAAGVNRLSIGAQSLDAGELRRLGRRHTPSDIADTVLSARRAGFTNVSLDLMYDVPGQTLTSWRRTLETAIRLEPDHVSAYALSLDDPDAEGLTGAGGDHLPLSAGARLWRERARCGQDQDLAAACYELADELLAAAELNWYELSNWARLNRQSRHNLAYWQGAPWVAVGPGAHAFDGRRTRRWNAARLDRYFAALLPSDDTPDRLPPGGTETTDERTARAERAILRLRTREGLPAAVASSADFGAAKAWARANGLIEPTADGGLRLTALGRLLANDVFVRLLPEPAVIAA